MSPNDINRGSSDPQQLWENPWNKMTYFWHNDHCEEATPVPVEGNTLGVPDGFLLRPRNFMCKVIQVDRHNTEPDPFIRISDNLRCETFGATRPRLSGRIKAPPTSCTECTQSPDASCLKEDEILITNHYPKCTQGKYDKPKRLYKIKRSRNIVKFDKGAIQRWREEETRNRTREIFREIREASTFKHGPSTEPFEFCEFCSNTLSPFGFCKECLEKSDTLLRILPRVEEETSVHCTCTPCTVENNLCNLECQAYREDYRENGNEKTNLHNAGINNTNSDEKGAETQYCVHCRETQKSEVAAPMTEEINTVESGVPSELNGETTGSFEIEAQGPDFCEIRQSGLSERTRSSEISKSTISSGKRQSCNISGNEETTETGTAGSLMVDSTTYTSTDTDYSYRTGSTASSSMATMPSGSAGTTRSTCTGCSEATGTRETDTAAQINTPQTSLADHSPATGTTTTEFSEGAANATAVTNTTADPLEITGTEKGCSETTGIETASSEPPETSGVCKTKPDYSPGGLEKADPSRTSSTVKETREMETQTDLPSLLSDPFCTCQYGPQLPYPDPHSSPHPLPLPPPLPPPQVPPPPPPPVQTFVLKAPFAVGLEVGYAGPSDVTIVLYANRILVAEVLQRALFSECVLSQAWDLPEDVDETSIRCFLGEGKLLIIALPLSQGFTWPFVSPPIPLGPPRPTIRDCRIHL